MNTTTRLARDPEGHYRPTFFACASAVLEAQHKQVTLAKFDKFDQITNAYIWEIARHYHGGSMVEWVKQAIGGDGAFDVMDRLRPHALY